MVSGHIAVDLGAESGRVLVVTLDDQCARFDEVHRFPNELVTLPSGLHWDMTGLWNEVVRGLELAGKWSEQTGIELRSVGVDTWGVDWAIIDSGGELVGMPHAYRDPRNVEAFQAASKIVSHSAAYQATGIQIMPINSLYSLYALRLNNPDLLDAANKLLFIPDLFNYWLSGVACVESSIASTSQMLDVRNGTWCESILRDLDLPKKILGELISSGTVIGDLLPEVAEQAGLNPGIQVVASAGHDTAAAVAAVPSEGNSPWCFLSSGTWSLLGMEINQPCINAQSQDAMFTNELGVDNTVRFLKNIAGLWLVQECRRDFSLRGKEYDYAELTELARLAEPFRTLVDPDHSPFQSPGNILSKIDEFATSTNQPLPETPGDYLRCCLESLALAYRQTIEGLEEVLDTTVDTIHIVGGGGQNGVLNEFTANASGKTVVVGPFEATAIGNGLVQAMAIGLLDSCQELRTVVRNSFELQTFEPAESDRWNESYERFQSLPGRAAAIA